MSIAIFFTHFDKRSLVHSKSHLVGIFFVENQTLYSHRCTRTDRVYHYTLLQSLSIQILFHWVVQATLSTYSLQWAEKNTKLIDFMQHYGSFPFNQNVWENSKNSPMGRNWFPGKFSRKYETCRLPEMWTIREKIPEIWGGKSNKTELPGIVPPQIWVSLARLSSGSSNKKRFSRDEKFRYNPLKIFSDECNGVFWNFGGKDSLASYAYRDFPKFSYFRLNGSVLFINSTISGFSGNFSRKLQHQLSPFRKFGIFGWMESDEKMI